MRTDLLPKLADVRMNTQLNHDSAVPPDVHMENTLELFSTLKERFNQDEDAVKIIQREIGFAKEWVAETEPPASTVSPRTLGTMEPSEGRHGTRSIFDDIDDDAA